MSITEDQVIEALEIIQKYCTSRAMCHSSCLLYGIGGCIFEHPLMNDYPDMNEYPESWNLKLLTKETKP